MATHGGDMTTPSPSPFSFEAMLGSFFSALERPDAPPTTMEDWQALGVLLLLRPILQKAAEEGDRRRIPPAAFLVTLDQYQGHIAYNETIRVRGTLASGMSEDIGFEALWTRYQELHDVAPLTPCLAYVLYVQRRLFAWDVRSVPPALAHHPELHRELGLFSRGPQEARAHRWAAFRRLSPQERAEVVRDALTSAIFDPGRKCVPLKGLLVNGRVGVLDTGDVVEPFRFFRFFDAFLGIGRQTATTASALSKQDQHTYDTFSSPTPKPLSEDVEDQIQELTASLHGAEKAAVQHYLRAKAYDISLKDYCRQYSLPYKSLHKAVQRGLTHLRQKH
jgi:hypothetical protein